MRDSKKLSPEQVVDILVQMAPHTEVASHDQGKIKFRLFWSGLGLLDRLNFEALMESIPGILNTRVRLLSRTIVIDYDQARLPRELWDDVARLKDQPEIAEQVGTRLRHILEHATT